MSFEVLSGKKFAWYHFSNLEEKDIVVLERDFKFHPLDFDDLRDDSELPKIDVYKYYLFAIFYVPTFDREKMRLGKQNLSVFIGDDYIVTVTKELIEPVERFFSRVKRSSGLRRAVMAKNTGFLLYKLLDYVFRDAKVILREIVREANAVETAVYDEGTQVTTRKLGQLRRNVLFMRHIIDPQRMIVDQITRTRKPFAPSDLQVYFDDVKDALDNIWVVAANLKIMVDGLFDVNESFLTHRTNEIIRILTVISLIFMPPTLITGYYGMNIDNLPLSDSFITVSAIIIASMLAVWFVVIHLDRRR